MKGLKGLLGGLMDGMRDDEGPFQGGEEGRVGGRFRDMLQGKSTSYDPGMEEDNELSVHARDFAKNMDVGNKDDVFEMQSMLAKLGIGDFEGKQLKADGMMGDRTTSAMRMLQGLDYEGGESVEPEQGTPWSGGEEDGNTGRGWIDKLFGGAGKDTRKVRNKLFDRKIAVENPDAAGGPMDPRWGGNVWSRKSPTKSGGGSGPGPWSDGSGY